VEREIAAGMGDAWEEALRAWDGRLDRAEARKAAKRFEALAKREAENPDAWAWCARSSYFLGDYEPDNARRHDHFERGMKLGQRGIELEGRHPASLFWTSVCEASYVERIGMLRRATYVPEILGYMKRLWDDEPTYYCRGAARLLGQALVRQPGLVRRFLPVVLPGIGPDTVIRELRETLAESPPIVLAHQTLAQVLHAVEGDRAAVREQIEAIEALDPDANPLFATENHLDRPRALELLRKLR
jgi:hypothetical protein